MRYLIDKKRPLIAERPFQMFGGDGGSRTPVRQSSAIGSTCLVTSII